MKKLTFKSTAKCKLDNCNMEEYLFTNFEVDASGNLCDNCPMMEVANELHRYEYPYKDSLFLKKTKELLCDVVVHFFTDKYGILREYRNDGNKELLYDFVRHFFRAYEEITLQIDTFNVDCGPSGSEHLMIIIIKRGAALETITFNYKYGDR